MKTDIQEALEAKGFVLRDGIYMKVEQAINSFKKAHEREKLADPNQRNRLNIRPLSINEGYTGRRFKTKAHRAWHKSIIEALPNDFNMPNRLYELYLKFGFATSASDGDNCIKFFQDCLAKKYKFNDKLIRKWVIEKDVVGKGNEYIEWKLTSIK